MTLTFLERTQESRHYIGKFTEYLRRGVLGGDPQHPTEHTYSIQSPFFPEAKTWQGSSTAPRSVAYYAENLTLALKQGEAIEGLPQIRHLFAEMAQTLKVAEIYVDTDYKFARNAEESIAIARPAIQEAIEQIDLTLEATPS